MRHLCSSFEEEIKRLSENAQSYSNPTVTAKKASPLTVPPVITQPGGTEQPPEPGALQPSTNAEGVSEAMGGGVGGVGGVGGGVSASTTASVGDTPAIGGHVQQVLFTDKWSFFENELFSLTKSFAGAFDRSFYTDGDSGYESDIVR